MQHRVRRFYDVTATAPASGDKSAAANAAAEPTEAADEFTPPPTVDSDGRGVFVVPPQTGPRVRGRHQLFKKILAAHRGEGAVRIFRATTELSIASCGVYAFEDRLSPHRYKSDESFMIRGTSPVAAYTDVAAVVKAARSAGADAVHPGYGLLAESASFADACQRASIVFIGPPAATLRSLADRTAVRALAQRVGLPVLPGSQEPLKSIDSVRNAIGVHGLPLIVKPARRGARGSRGHVIAADGDVVDAVARATRDAAADGGDSTVMVERYLAAARHIEVQVRS